MPRPGATALRSAAGQEGRHDLTTQTPVLPTTGWSRLAGHPGRVTSCSTRSPSRSSASSAPALRRCIRRSQVARVVESDAFADAWVQANRVAHAELVAALTGEGGGSLTVENDTVSVNLAAFIETVKQRLVESGFTVAARIPEVNASFVLFQSDDITRARSGFNLLNTLGVWLPVIALVLLVLGVYIARDHRRALVGAAVGVAGSMVVLASGLAVFRSVYLDAVPASVVPHDAAAVAYDTIVRFLRLGLRTILVLALVVAAAAFLTGQSVTAVRTRQRLSNAIGWLAGGAERAGFSTGPVGTWMYANKQALRIGAVALTALALVFWAGRPARSSSASPSPCWSSWPSSNSSGGRRRPSVDDSSERRPRDRSTARHPAVENTVTVKYRASVRDSGSAKSSLPDPAIR